MGNKKESSQEIMQTKLSKQQLNILKSRETFYQEFTLPALQDYYQATQNFELNDQFETLVDLTDNLDAMFSDDAEERSIGQSLLRQGFDEETRQIAMDRVEGRSAAGKERVFSQGNLSQILAANQATGLQNQVASQEHNVRAQGVQALTGGAPRPTTQVTQGSTTTTSGGSGLSATIGGAVGGIFSDKGVQSSITDLFRDTSLDFKGGFASNPNTSTNFLSGPSSF